MSKATYPLKLPISVKKAGGWLAKEDGVSLKQGSRRRLRKRLEWTAAEFFKKRGGKATGDGLMRFLRSAPKNDRSPKIKFASSLAKVVEHSGRPQVFPAGKRER